MGDFGERYYVECVDEPSTLVPNSVLGWLRPRELAVYVVLRSFSGPGYNSQPSRAKVCGLARVSIPTYLKAVARLEELGLVTREVRAGKEDRFRIRR